MSNVPSRDATIEKLREALAMCKALTQPTMDRHRSIDNKDAYLINQVASEALEVTAIPVIPLNGQYPVAIGKG